MLVCSLRHRDLHPLSNLSTTVCYMLQWVILDRCSMLFVRCFFCFGYTMYSTSEMFNLFITFPLFIQSCNLCWSSQAPFLTWSFAPGSWPFCRSNIGKTPVSNRPLWNPRWHLRNASKWNIFLTSDQGWRSFRNNGQFGFPLCKFDKSFINKYLVRWSSH
jgi:hypothetical protein